MGVRIDDQALRTAAADMLALQQRNQRLRDKLEQMFKNLTDALDTPAGHAIQWTGQDVLVKPIDDMGKVIKFMSDTLNTIIGQGEDGGGTYYDKLFDEYYELDRILKSKTTQ